jgi:hypothetical protein
MNFKPTLIKSIVSVVIGLIIGLIIGWQQYVTPTNLVWRFILGVFLLFLIIGFIIPYIILSLFKLNKWKIMGTLIIWILFNLYLFYSLSYSCFCGNLKPCVCPFDFNYGISQTFLNPLNYLYLIAVYIVWSLFEIKKVNNRKK